MSETPTTSCPPVVMLVFNRPEQAALVLEAVCRARPPRLWVVCDGPRPDRAGEAERVAAVRALFERPFDWSCEVRRVFSETNLGCGTRVATGLTTVFEHESEAIILEDDCLPVPGFFRFCAELLERYRDDPRVAHIAGAPFYWETVRRESSYLFSHYGPIWGWATWRRAWATYDLHLRDWPRLREERWLRTMGFGPREIRERSAIFDRLHGGDLHAWSYQWSLSKWRQGQLSVVPTVTMVRNIGLVGEGTHRHAAWIRRIRATEPAFPLRHPAAVSRDVAFDAAWAERFVPSLARRAFNRLVPFLGRPPLELT